MATPHLTELIARSVLADHRRAVDAANGRGWKSGSGHRQPELVGGVRAVVGDRLIRLGVRIAGYQPPPQRSGRTSPAFPS